MKHWEDKEAELKPLRSSWYPGGCTACPLLLQLHPRAPGGSGLRTPPACSAPVGGLPPQPVARAPAALPAGGVAGFEAMTKQETGQLF